MRISAPATTLPLPPSSRCLFDGSTGQIIGWTASPTRGSRSADTGESDAAKRRAGRCLLRCGGGGVRAVPSAGRGQEGERGRWRSMRIGLGGRGNRAASASASMPSQRLRACQPLPRCKTLAALDIKSPPPPRLCQVTYPAFTPNLPCNRHRVQRLCRLGRLAVSRPHRVPARKQVESKCWRGSILPALFWSLKKMSLTCASDRHLLL